MTAPRIVLASGSPRRRRMLSQLGLEFAVVPAPPGTEVPWGGEEEPTEYARRIAEAKARAVFIDHADALVVGADTIVVLDGRVLGKPADADDAKAMLARLAGRDHRVDTGLALIARDAFVTGSESTMVSFRDLRGDEIDDYVATGEPLDKAGAYGIQAFGATLVEGVSGCYFNVMGLPVARLLTLLREAGWEYRVPGRLRPIAVPT